MADNIDDRNVLILARTEGDHVRVYLGNLTYTWHDYTYREFLRQAFLDAQWRREILRRIARNDEWYNEIQQYRNER
jgi:hypothetical protein